MDRMGFVCACLGFFFVMRDSEVPLEKNGTRKRKYICDVQNSFVTCETFCNEST